MDKKYEIIDRLFIPDIFKDYIPTFPNNRLVINDKVTDNSVEDYILALEKQSPAVFEDEDTVLALLAEPIIHSLIDYNPSVSVLIINRDGIVICSPSAPEKLGKMCYLSLPLNKGAFDNRSPVNQELKQGNFVVLLFDTLVKNVPYVTHVFASPMFYRNSFLGYLACMAPSDDLLNQYKDLIKCGSKIIESQYSEYMYTGLLTESTTDCALITNNNHIIINCNKYVKELFGFNPIGRDVDTVLEESCRFEQIVSTTSSDLTFYINSPNKNERIHCRRLLSHRIKTIFGGKNQFILTFKPLHDKYKSTVLPDRNSPESSTAFIGQTPVIAEIKNLVDKVAKTSAAILIQGETGTGKDVLAKFIHERSQRKGAFVSVNCGAMTRELINSEFFGYEEGAFTGAMRGGKIGKIERANQGTLFLNEIGELPLETQTHILSFLDTKQVTRVGSTISKEVDVRIIAATNSDLRAKVAEGTFREDLYYRLNVVDINMPPLRVRKNDVPALANHFLKLLCEEYALPNKILTDQALDLLSKYDWPGNIRELKNLIAKALITSNDSEIGLDVFNSILSASVNQMSDISSLTRLAEFEKLAIMKALEESNGVISRAATSLDISRPTLHKKIKLYNISVANKANITA